MFIRWKLYEKIKIFIPLSYGGTDEYVDEVTKCANNLFPGKVKILTDFMPLEQYNKITEAAEALNTTVGKISSRISRDKPTKTLLKSDGKEYLITRDILQ